MISRSLGPEFGGSIGLIFSVANAVAVALYVVGFAETVKDLIKEHGGGVEVIGELNIIRIVGIGTVILLLCVTLVGLEWVVRTQMFLLCILLVSIVDVIIGTFIGPLNEKSEARGFVGLSLNLFKENFGPAYREGENFFSVFAVFFPAATGILAGVNISGDLKDAQKGIPKGTLWAIIISTIVYVALDWLALACVLRDASGIIVLANQTIANVTSTPAQHCSVDFSCEYGLMNDYQVCYFVCSENNYNIYEKCCSPRCPSQYLYSLRNSNDNLLLSYPSFISKATLGDRSFIFNILDLTLLTDCHAHLSIFMDT